jgi:serine phosphatase RsbU (regulator of sigma subunit)/ligand-binding sensor domain-containing protein
MNRLFYSLILLGISSVSFTQGLLSRNFGKNEGFKSQVGWSVYTDSRGLIWADMGSEGVAIWDGQNFSYLTEKDGMAGNMVNAFSEGADGRIYIGCQGKGLSIYDGYRFENYSTADSIGLTSDNIMSMLLHSSGDLYMGTYLGGLYKYKDGFFEKVLDSANAEIIVFDIKEDRNGDIWFTTGIKGLGHLSGEEFEFFGEEVGLPQKMMLDLELADNGDVYLGNYYGLYRMRDGEVEKSWTFSQDGYSSDVIQAMVLLNTQELLLSTIEGLFILKEDSIVKISSHGQIKAHLTEMTLDKNGNAWATSNGQGLYQILNQDIWAYELPTPETKLRKSLQFPNGDLLFVATNRIYKATEKGYEKLGDDLEKKVSKILNAYVLQQDKILILSKSNGVGVYEKKGNEWILNIFNTSNALAYAEPKNNGKWVFSANWNWAEGEIEKREFDTIIRPTPYKAAFLPVEGNGEIFWIGRYDEPGILEIGLEDTVMITPEHGIAGNSVIHLQLDRNGTLWYLNIDGYFGYRKSKFEYVTFDSYSSNGAYNITFDLNNDLWILYKDIIVYVDLEGYEIKRTRLFGQADGIHKSEGRFHENVVLADGRIVFVKPQDQSYIIDPSKITFPDESPDLFVKQINGKDDILLDSSWVKKPTGIYQTPTEINLPSADNHLTVHLGGSYFSYPDSLRFMYFLEGLDENWSVPQQSGDITITNIPNGQYVLKLKAIGAFGQESETISIPVIIQTPWYKSIWFYLTVIVLLAVSVLGFIKWRTEKLKRENEKLESLVNERTKEVVIEKEKVEEKNKEIEDSINYAKRIQKAILPPDKLIKEILPESFIMYIPKDIVAGDFYWMDRRNGSTYFAAADCTGHGVPGAMVSVICNNGLKRALKEFNCESPAAILDKTREIVLSEFEQSEEEVKDGMDIALCRVSGKKLEYSGAHNPLWIIRKSDSGEDELIEVKADKQPVGKFENATDFTNHSLDLKSNDMIYVFSDGFADQFGGPKGKKFKSANFKKLLLSLQDKSVDDQLSELHKVFIEWKGTFEQLDDICILGVKVD